MINRGVWSGRWRSVSYACGEWGLLLDWWQPVRHFSSRGGLFSLYIHAENICMCQKPFCVFMCMMWPFWVNETMTFSWRCIGFQPPLEPLEEQSAPASQKPCLSEKTRFQKLNIGPILGIFFLCKHTVQWKISSCASFSPYDVIPKLSEWKRRRKKKVQINK